MSNAIIELKNSVIYFTLFGLYSSIFIYDALVLNEKRSKRPDIVNPKFGGQLKYLTFIDLVSLYLIYGNKRK